MPPLLNALEPRSWPLLILVSGRVVGMLMIAPLWSLGSIPGKIRGALGLVIALLLVPLMPPLEMPSEVIGVPIMLGSEILLGVTIGLSAAVFLHGVALAGEVIAMQMGLSLGAALGVGDLGSPGVGELETLFTLALYVGIGGHLMLIATVGNSFIAIPPGAPIDLAGGARAMIHLAGSLFGVAARIAAPAIAALLLTNIALAILNKAVPQLNTMMVAFPVTIGLGLLVLAASLPFVATYVTNWAGGLGALADRVVDPFIILAPVR